MSIDLHHSRIRLAILAVLVGAPIVACGRLADDNDESGSNSNGNSSTNDGGNSSGFVCNPQPLESMATIAAGLCADDGGATDASSDADTTDAGVIDVDAGSDADGGADAGICYASCEEACMHMGYVGASGGPTSCSVGRSAAGTPEITCNFLRAGHCGRAFDALAPLDAHDATGLGRLFAGMAWMEAASISAFRRLARELAHHGAPEHLVRAARDSARDEARHARLMGRLARWHGASVPRVVEAPFVMRSLEDVARENVVEACVGETYGAALAAWQALHARDAEVRAVMESIAPDELRHAALGYAIADWADAKLDASASRRVADAKRAALDALLARHEGAVSDAESIREAGMPSPIDAARLAFAVARAA
jgi:hypothetical protein